MRANAALFALLGLVACTPVGPVAPVVEAPQPRTVAAAQDPGAFDAAIDAARSANGLGGLHPDARLMRAAQRHAEDMAARGYFGHDTPEGTSFVQRAAAQGVGGCWMSENIAQGPFTATSVVAAWMASTGHRRNILSGRASIYGLGAQGGHWVMVLAGAC